MKGDDMTDLDKSTNGPITVVWDWNVKADKEELFEHMMHDIHKAALAFPGHMGVTTLKLPSQKGKFQTILRFDTSKHLEDWLHSDIRQRMIGRLEEVAQINKSSKATGLETWFNIPGQHVTSPPRWKMVATTFIAIYPLSLLYGYMVAPNTLTWPVAVRALILPIFAPIILTYLFMPFLTQHALRKWLYRNS